MVKRLVVALAASAFAAAPAAAATPPIRLAILHVVQSCHVWSIGGKPTLTLSVEPGARIVLRPTCPMDFELAQTRGPRLVLGESRLHAGTQRTIVFARRGSYRLTATNVQTPEEAGLQTLGSPNTLVLVVRVR